MHACVYIYVYIHVKKHHLKTTSQPLQLWGPDDEKLRPILKQRLSWQRGGGELEMRGGWERGCGWWGGGGGRGGRGGGRGGRVCDRNMDAEISRPWRSPYVYIYMYIYLYVYIYICIYDYPHDFELCLRYPILWLYWDYAGNVQVMLGFGPHLALFKDPEVQVRPALQP